MPDETTTAAYWDRVAEETDFTFPVDYELIEEHLPRDARVLEERFGKGALKIGDQGVVRHLSEPTFRDITTDFTTIHRARVSGESLEENILDIIEYLGRLRS